MINIESPHSLSKVEVLKQLQASDTGLSTGEVKKRLEEYGPNVLTQKNKTSPFSILVSQFKNTLTLILLGAVGLVLFIYFFGERHTSDLIEAGLILAIVLMITFLGFIQEYKAEKALESLKKLLAFKAKIKRDGHEAEIDVADIVPGDIIILEEGLKVPADIRMLESISLHVNEASLTGESLTVEKSEKVLLEKTQIADQTNMIFAGTVITSGRGVGVVIHTGDNTEIGKIAGLVAAEKNEPTPIQQRLDAIGKSIGYIVVGVCAFVFLFIFFLASDYANLPFAQKLIASFIASVALAVAAIPEGLPAVVTISLAIGTQRMARKQALMRKLNAVETLGSVDVICSDKTGTMTKNEMTVRELFFNNDHFVVSGTGYELTGEILKNKIRIDPLDVKLLMEAGMYANNAQVDDSSTLGDPTEVALLISGKKAGFLKTFERVHEIPFTSERKMMSVVVKDKDRYLLFVKGAPEILINHSRSLFENNKSRQMQKADRDNLSNQADAMNSRALRSLGFAYRELTKKEYESLKKDDKKLESDLIFLGLQGMIDPPRDEVKPLIEKCKASGIRVIMITGDHEVTARAVANEIGIIGESIAGNIVDEMNDEEFIKTVEKISIYARVNPSTKMKIVNALKKNGHIVAMTGDGVNDAPAMKKADIGIAMGITGTDVAKEASDMVLLDDKFSTIVHAIEEGRGIFQNIRKFVQYLLSCNIGEVILIFTGVLLFRDLPLTATMLLWINVVTDGLPAVALGMDQPEENIMKLSPKKFQTEIITKKLWIEMTAFGALLTVAILGLYYYNLIHENSIEAKGAAFIAIAFFELVYLFIIRANYGTRFFSNKWLWIAIIVTMVMQVAIVYTPFLAGLFEVRHIDLFDWVYILTASIVMWILFSLFKKYLII